MASLHWARTIPIYQSPTSPRPSPKCVAKTTGLGPSIPICQSPHLPPPPPPPFQLRIDPPYARADIKTLDDSAKADFIDRLGNMVRAAWVGGCMDGCVHVCVSSEGGICVYAGTWCVRRGWVGGWMGGWVYVCVSLKGVFRGWVLCIYWVVDTVWACVYAYVRAHCVLPVWY